ncbi:GDSL-type esterase/lipase family protein [Novosphingobium sp.]|uniref:GDSL-type esterase/lipase family protein n=1 Tax=Novosphingobium sp. TaxID=1874826 RepID=UPI0033426D27
MPRALAMLALAATMATVAPAQARQTAGAPPPSPAAVAPEAVAAPVLAPDAVTAITAQPCAPPPNAPADWAALCRYHDANRALATPPRVVLIGDSITEGWISTDPALFTADVVDRGVSGQTSVQIMARFYQDVVRLHPRVVHILCGTNDIAGNTGPTSPDAFANAVLAMVDMARANHIAVVLGSIPPAGAFGWRPGFRPATQITAFNQWLRDLARQRGLVYADYHSAMADAADAMKPWLSSDGVHPNAAGYALMLPIARAAIAEAEAPAPIAARQDFRPPVRRR